jgi:uncharacterized protein YbjT (DUF2867 family)
MRRMERTALIAGATGLVGRHCLRRLLADPRYARVTAIVRRSTGVSDSKLEEVVVDFDRLAERAAAIRGEDFFCCLGTTIRDAGSQAAFRRIDHDLVVELARLARANGARRLAYVSSVGADAGSRAFYMRSKGETERDLGALGYEQVEVLRPSFLVGERERGRTGEAAGIAVARGLAGLLIGGLRKYRPISADTVAAGMIGALRRDEAGARVRSFDEIVELSRV